MGKSQKKINESLTRRIEDDVAEITQINDTLLNEVNLPKLAEESLSKIADWSCSLIENISDVVAILDSDFIFRYISPLAERTLGYRSENIIDQAMFDLVHPDDLIYRHFYNSFLLINSEIFWLCSKRHNIMMGHGLCERNGN